MKPFLLDSNVLIALFWPAHDHHEDAQRWFHSQPRLRWATCPLTQSAFVRITSNPRFSRDAVSPREASERLAANLKNPQHRFLPADLAYGEATSPFAERLRGHQQVTDGYLLGLAMHHRAMLSTFDTGILALAPEGSATRRSLEILTVSRVD